MQNSTKFLLKTNLCYVLHSIFYRWNISPVGLISYLIIIFWSRYSEWEWKMQEHPPCKKMTKQKLPATSQKPIKIQCFKTENCLMEIYHIMFLSRSYCTFLIFHVVSFEQLLQCIWEEMCIHPLPSSQVWDAILCGWASTTLQDCMDSSDKFFSLILSTFAWWYLCQGSELANLSI